MNRTLPILLAALAIPVAGGCALVEHNREFWRQTKRIYTPRPYDHRDVTEEVGDPWGGVADPIRADQPREADPDPWFKQWFMSEEARSIERNLGFD